MFYLTLVGIWLNLEGLYLLIFYKELMSKWILLNILKENVKSGLIKKTLFGMKTNLKQSF